MAEFKLSRIRYTWKGQWAADVDYNVDDVVSYGGKSYVSLSQHTASADFYDDLENYNTDTPPVLTPKWELMMDGYRFRGNWTTSRLYSVGDIAKYFGITYICTISHTSASTVDGFETDLSNWTTYIESLQWKGAWATSTYYKLNDIVKLNGLTYKCINEHTSNSDSNIGIEPDLILGNWETYVYGYSWNSSWQENTKYEINDIVKFGGNVYRCTTAHLSDSYFETDILNWTTVYETTEFVGDWQPLTRYKLDDIVKFGGNLWKCNDGHTSTTSFDETLWSTFLPGTDYIPGYEYEDVWAYDQIYQPGDIVRYGGYLYISLTNNQGTQPELISDDWELLLIGARVRGQWSVLEAYKTGDVVRYGGSLYEALKDSQEEQPTVDDEINSIYWEIVVPGEAWKKDWKISTTYAIGDVVHWISNTYRCKFTHVSDEPSRPDNDTLNTYWELYIVGDSANVLKELGEIKTYTSSGIVALSVGQSGTTLKNVNGSAVWANYNLSPDVYYVAPNGVDDLSHGLTLNAPWRTIRYACENVTGPATIFIKTGLYSEILPIKVPANVALVVDEIRGVIVEPSSTIIPESDVPYSLLALEYISSLMLDIVAANTIPPLTELVSQDTSNTPATITEGLYLQSLLTTIRQVIDTGSQPEISGTNTITIDSNKLNAAVQIEENVEFIVAQTIEYFASQYPSYSFDTATCSRDIRKFLEAIVYDIKYPGNYKSVETANYYRNAANGELNSSSNMFYLRDNTGLRNMTFRGLTGILDPEGFDLGETRRITGGVFVSFDPGWGPDDSRTWITTRSPYIQNCTAFGAECVGMKLDGDLHADGLKSMVANDFTQILDDGIGIWVNKDAKTEIVSVFTYYNHIGYLAENGGKIRATNGNNSYGHYGSVSEGVNPVEDPITATVNNRYYQATIGSVLCNVSGGIMKVLYTNAGQDYTTANFTVNGSGYGAVLEGTEFRHGAVSEVRLVDPGDSSTPGGGGYYYTTNTSQGGDSTTITLAGSDEGLEENYIGMRVFITKGMGVGQYGYITAYDDVSKEATIARESDDEPGWDHIVPGTPIESILDNTAVYSVEPRVSFTSPGQSVATATLPALRHWTSVTYGNGKFVAISHETDNSAGNTAGYSTNGTSWSTSTLPTTALWTDITYGDGTFVAVGYGTSAAYSTNGTSWTAATLPNGDWTSVTYGSGTFVAVSGGGTLAAYSTDNGETWSSATLPEGADWSAVTYGSGKFVAVAFSDSTTTQTVFSTDGETWSSGSFAGGASCITYGAGKFVAFDGATSGDTIFYSLDGENWEEITIDVPQTWTDVAYGGGRFVAVANNYDKVLTSEDGITWSTIDLASTASWTSVAYGPVSSSAPKFVLVSGNTAGSVVGNTLQAGVKTQARVKVVSGRISEFNIWEPGSGYVSAPTLTLTDPNATSDATVSVKLNNGVLASPDVKSAGVNYQTQTTTAEVIGDGFMESYQLGKSLVVSNLSRIPRPGANLNISGINDYTYKVTSVEVLEGISAPYVAKLVIIKALGYEESPAHGTNISIREQYSQIRITGHDLLNIGLGNIYETNFPDILHPRGTVAAPENEVIERNGGRVFYTSTNDLGNFRVGELFAVEQATGTVTLNADFFSLQGLEELRLGGVSVGTTAVVIREFSTDTTFTADSNNIVPTERAIKAYLTRRVSGGGADAITGGVLSGLISIGSPNKIEATFGDINIPVKVKFTGGIDGTMLAMAYFQRRA